MATMVLNLLWILIMAPVLTNENVCFVFSQNNLLDKKIRENSEFVSQNKKID